MAARITVGVLLLLGLVTGAGGVWLLTLGGSAYYLALGIALVVVASLIFAGRRLAIGLYALALLGTLAWAVWEAGFDWWSLTPRGVVPTLIGLWLLVPWVRRRLHGGARWSTPTLTAAIVLVAVTAGYSLAVDSRATTGTLPPAAAAAPAAPVPDMPASDWRTYGGSPFGQRYSSLTGITRDNVANLRPAWTYHTGESRGATDPKETTFEVTPLKIGDSLFLCTPHNVAVALDPATGKERWRFDPKIAVGLISEHLTCRGLSYHADVSASADAACAQRLLLPTIDARLFALDARTGRPCADFGTGGHIDLTAHMPNMKPGYYMATSPPVVTRDLVILGAAIDDNVSVANPSGVVRAFDVRTGRLVWNFDPGNPSQTAPIADGETYTAGAPNTWSVSSVDETLGLVYVPFGNKSPDQWGVDRSANVERFSSAIVALDAGTGQVRWVAQTVHHDLWDRDVPSQPTLVDLTVKGETVPALIGPTKQGDLFVLDRRTGTPIFPVNEVPTPAKATEGDRASPTQPASTVTFMPPPLRERDMWGATFLDQLACRIAFRQLRYEGPYTPPSLEGSIVYPGNTGVFNWGGIAVDPVRQVMIGTPVNLAFIQRLVPRPNATANIVTDGKAPFGENYGGPYAAKMGPFLSILGLPCQAPPWGNIAGLDLKTGRTVWMHRNGTTRDQMPSVLPIPFEMGTPGLGGPLITAGGVVFYSGALDNELRAFDVTDGREVWKGRLPAGGQATPMTYRLPDGRQMVVVAAGGHGSFGTTLGDAVVAFTLGGS